MYQIIGIFFQPLSLPRPPPPQTHPSPCHNRRRPLGHSDAKSHAPLIGMPNLKLEIEIRRRKEGGRVEGGQADSRQERPERAECEAPL